MKDHVSNITTTTAESLFNMELPVNLAATLHKLKNEYMQADEAGKLALLNVLTGWLVYEKGQASYRKNNTQK